MDKRGIAIFLLITYGVTWGVELILIHGIGGVFAARTNVFMAVFAALMFVPMLAAVVASRLSPNDKTPRPKIWPIPMRPAVQAIIAIPILFFLIHGISVSVGEAAVDWELAKLSHTTPGTQDLTEQIPAFPYIFFVIGLGVVTVGGATLYAAVCFGSEYGWRGYLLPRLLPLGRPRAYLAVGALWALSFAPIILSGVEGVTGPQGGASSFIRFAAIALLFGAVLCEAYRRTENAGLCAVCCGLFAAHADYGIWSQVLAEQQLPWAGPFGFVAVVVWAIAAVFPSLIIGSRRREAPEGAEVVQQV